MTTITLQSMSRALMNRYHLKKHVLLLYNYYCTSSMGLSGVHERHGISTKVTQLFYWPICMTLSYHWTTLWSPASHPLVAGNCPIILLVVRRWPILLFAYRKWLLESVTNTLRACFHEYIYTYTCTLATLKFNNVVPPWSMTLNERSQPYRYMYMYMYMYVHCT